MKRHVRPEQQPRYAYDVEFAPQLAADVVAGSSGDGGFVSLVSLTGEIVKTRQGLPPMAAESRLILGWDGSNLIGVYPVRPRGIAVVRLSADATELAKVIDHPYAWECCRCTTAIERVGSRS